MNLKYQIPVPFIILLTIILSSFQFAKGQTTMPEVMDTATLQAQMNYIQEKTRIYNNFRAIREDIFLKMKANSLDSLSVAKNDISRLNETVDARNSEIESLNAELGSAREQLNTAVKNKNALTFLGIQMDKKYYNSLMWTIVVILAALLTILFIIFRRNRVITVEFRDDLNETKENFETYKKEARERYEKLVVSHHNEIMKLRGG